MSGMLQTLAQNQNNFLQLLQQQENQEDCLFIFMEEILNRSALEPTLPSPLAAIVAYASSEDNATITTTTNNNNTNNNDQSNA